MRSRLFLAGALALALTVLPIPEDTPSAVIQQGNLRITALSQVQPFKLPRYGTAPIAVFIAGHVASRDGSVPPQLQRMSIRVNRHGVLDPTGLPVCRRPQIAAVSTRQALENCGEALVGSGRFWATIVLPDQRPYPTRGRLLVFNGRRGNQPMLFAHIFTTKPFASSFTIAFAIQHIPHGTYGTRLTASLPQALGDWGFVDRIKLTLRRKFRFHGEQHSYFNAGCPAPAGARVTAYPLAHVEFDFADSGRIGLGLPKSCGVKE